MSEAPAPPIDNRRVAKGLGTTLLARMGGLVEIVSQPLYVAMFGLASFGFYAVLWATINLAENIFDLGMTSAMQRTVPQARDERQAAAALRAAMIVGVSCCLLVAILIFLFAPQVAPYLNVAARDQDLLVPAIRIFVWALPLWALVEIGTSSLRARHAFGPEIRLRIFWEQVIRFVLAAAAWLAGFGIVGLFLAHMASLTVTTLLAMRLVLRYYHWEDIRGGPFWPPIATETVKAGLAVLPANALARLFGDAPALILNIMLPGAQGASAGGLFTIARRLSSVVQIVRTAFAYVLAPLVSSAVRHDRSQINAIYGFATRLLMAVAFPLAATLAAGATILLGLFGPQAQAAEAAVIILFAARAAEAVAGASVPVQQVASGYWRQIFASLCGAGIAVATGIALHPALSALTAITTAVGIGLASAAAIPMIQLALADRLHPFGEGVGNLPAILFATVLGGAAALALRDLTLWLSLPLLTLSAIAATWLSLRYGLGMEDRLALGKTARRLRLVQPRAMQVDDRKTEC